jgi:cobalt-zinc-cadmium efflux system outer membrane protein
MHRRTRTGGPWRAVVTTMTATAMAAALAALLAAGAAAAQAQPAPGLAQAFEAAWARQPEAQALADRRQAARSQQAAAGAWTPEPAAVEITGKTDPLSGNHGARELDVGIAAPLWLPGERSRRAALADAEGAAVDSHAAAARLRLAASIREAWWAWQRARIEAYIARGQLDNARRIADDVARRMKAGDLARADQHQADGAVAAAESAVAQADAAVGSAALQLQGATGLPPAPVAPMPEADPGDAAPAPEAHATLQELQDRAAVAERSAALAATQSRANPELTLGATRERGSAGESYGQTLTLGVRWPLGGGARHDARIASARAEATGLQAQLALERERVGAERQAARGRLDAARLQVAAAERRARLARESRGFFEKSFRLGETDLPTRLRIEAEATEAERQAARARIEQAAALSAWRQALGLLPQ